MSSAPILSKSKILSLLQCPKRLWLEVHSQELTSDNEGLEARLAEGIQVGETARGIFPGGVLVEGKSMEARCRRTRELLRRHSGPLYEAAFRHKNVRVMADILIPVSGGFRLIEVKSSTSVKDYYSRDVAIQAWVLQGAGLELHRIDLAVIDPKFVYPGRGKYRGLFALHDMRREVQKLLPKISGWVREGLGVLASAKEPDIAPGDQCGKPFPCPFQEYCMPVTDEYPVECLPKIGKKAETLRAQGIGDIREYPAFFQAVRRAMPRPQSHEKRPRLLVHRGQKSDQQITMAALLHGL